MFSALSLAMDMRTRSQDNVLASQAYQLGDPKARLHSEQQQGPVAAPYPSGRVGCLQKGVDLFPIEKFDGPPFVSCGRHREDSLAKQRMGRFLESHVLKERMNCGQTDITSASTVLSLFLEMIKEIADERHVQILDHEFRGCFTEPFFGEMEEQTKRIAIARYGIRACSPLPAQAVCKKRLQKSGKTGWHYERFSFPLLNRRSVAN
jgi:hypothetical protein